MSLRLRIDLDMGNAAFGEDAGNRAEQVSFILRGWLRTKAVHGLENEDRWPLYDTNGNRVGTASTFESDA